jgi:hypothetical protein
MLTEPLSMSVLTLQTVEFKVSLSLDISRTRKLQNIIMTTGQELSLAGNKDIENPKEDIVESDIMTRSWVIRKLATIIEQEVSVQLSIQY